MPLNLDVYARIDRRTRWNGDCLEWTGCLCNGYGHITFEKKAYTAHRFIWKLYRGDPGPLHIDHLCRNRKCVNLQHMELVTPKVNVLRGVGITAINKAKAQCHRGHPFDEANTYWHKAERNCRQCRRDRKKKYRVHTL